MKFSFSCSSRSIGILWALAMASVCQAADLTSAEVVLADDSAVHLNEDEDQGLTSALLTQPKFFPFNHGSTIVETAPGELLACWFVGKKEADASNQIVCSRKKATDAVWGSPKVAVDRRESAENAVLTNRFIGNPVLFKDRQAGLWLFYEGVAIGGHSGAYVDYKFSKDRGLTWSRSKRLVGMFGNFGHLPRNKPLQFKNGLVGIPLYREFTSVYGYMRLAKLENGRITNYGDFVIPGTEHLQPTLVTMQKNGVDRLYAYLRNKKKGAVLFSEFHWASRTWSRPVAINLANPNSAVDVVATPDGHVLMVYNDSPVERSPLSLAISRDGRSFVKLFDFETKKNVGYSYPALIRDSSGNYHVTYTYELTAVKHAAFSQTWLDQRVAGQR